MKWTELSSDDRALVTAKLRIIAYQAADANASGLIEPFMSAADYLEAAPAVTAKDVSTICSRCGHRKDEHFMQRECMGGEVGCTCPAFTESPPVEADEPWPAEALVFELKQLFGGGTFVVELCEWDQDSIRTYSEFDLLHGFDRASFVRHAKPLTPAASLMLDAIRGAR